MEQASQPVVLRKVVWRLIPFLFVLYIVAYLDRVNVSFAGLQMRRDLRLDEAVFGFGAGVFFLGYALFEIPSNLLLQRVGARLWMARIMVTWGVLSAATMFVRTAESFYLLRFLLGLAEAGFFPGMILYLTYWFPAAERARAVALFMTATALAGVIGGPLSGALLGWHGRGGLAGWQWLFLIEGLPSVVLGFAVIAWLPDGPAQARWLNPEERAWIEARVRADEYPGGHEHRLGPALRHPVLWWLCAVYFSVTIGMYGLGVWLPEIIKQLGYSDFRVGLLTAVPYLAATIGMVLVGAHSDRTGERRGHVAASLVLTALSLILAAVIRHPLAQLPLLSLAAIGIWSAPGPFWALPTAFLRGTAAAGGIALVNAVGNLGGFVGPYLLGWLKRATSGFGAGFVCLAVVNLLGAAIILSLRAHPRGDHP